VEPAGAYYRVSTKDQAERYGLASQAEAVEKYAAANDLEIVAEFSDAETGQTEARPGVQEALAAAKDGQFESLILYDHTRLGRSVKVSSSLRNEFQSAGVQLHYTTSGTYDSDSETGVILDAVSDAMSEVEVMRMTRRMSAGRYRAAKDGFVPIGGRIPFGYDRDKKEGGTKLKVKESEAIQVRNIFQAWNEGQSSEELATRLNEGKVPRHEITPWTAQNVLAILHNETYRGTWHYGKSKTKRGKRTQNPREGWVEVKVPEIVDDATFIEAQFKLASFARKYEGNIKHTYLLRGRIRCGVCGRSYWGTTIRQKYGYYVHHPELCDNPSTRFNQKEIERSAKEFMFTWLEGPADIEALIQDDLEATDVVRKQLDKVIKRREKLAQDYQRALKLRSEGEFSKEDLDAERLRISDEDDKLKEDEQNLREQAEPDFYELDSLMQNLQIFAAGVEKYGPDFFSEQQWFEYADWFDLKVEVLEDEYILSARLGEKVLSTDNQQS